MSMNRNIVTGRMLANSHAALVRRLDKRLGHQQHKIHVTLAFELVAVATNTFQEISGTHSEKWSAEYVEDAVSGCYLLDWDEALDEQWMLAGRPVRR